MLRKNNEKPLKQDRYNKHYIQYGDVIVNILNRYNNML